MIITIIIEIRAQIFIVVYNKIYKNTKNIQQIATISGTYAQIFSVAFNNDCKNCKNDYQCTKKFKKCKNIWQMQY